jgi:hypothetical protein
MTRKKKLTAPLARSSAFQRPAAAAQNAPKFAPLPATAPTPRTTALGARRANVGALVALVGAASRAGTHQVWLERRRRGPRGSVAIASLAERGPLLRGARRPLIVGVSSNTYALRGASMMPGKRPASAGSSSRSRTSKPTSSANQGVPLAAYMRPTPVWYACRTMNSTSDLPWPCRRCVARTASARSTAAAPYSSSTTMPMAMRRTRGRRTCASRPQAPATAPALGTTSPAATRSRPARRRARVRGRTAAAPSACRFGPSCGAPALAAPAAAKPPHGVRPGASRATCRAGSRRARRPPRRCDAARRRVVPRARLAATSSMAGLGPCGPLRLASPLQSSGSRDARLRSTCPEGTRSRGDGLTVGTERIGESVPALSAQVLGVAVRAPSWVSTNIRICPKAVHRERSQAAPHTELDGGRESDAAREEDGLGERSPGLFSAVRRPPLGRC